jgi:hypothetical protein
MDAFGAFPGMVEDEPKRTLRSRTHEEGRERPFYLEYSQHSYTAGHHQRVPGPYGAFCDKFCAIARKGDVYLEDEPLGGGYFFSCVEGRSLVTGILYVFKLDGDLELEMKYYGGNRTLYYDLVRWWNEELGVNFSTLNLRPPGPTIFVPETADLDRLLEHVQYHEWAFVYDGLSRKLRHFPTLFAVEGAAVELTKRAMAVDTSHDVEENALKWQFAAHLIRYEDAAPELVDMVAEMGTDLTNGHVRRFYLWTCLGLVKRGIDVKDLVPLARAELEINEMRTSCYYAAEILSLCA